MKINISKQRLVRLIKEETKTLAAMNQPSGDIASAMPPRGVLKALRAFMRDGEQLHPEAYINHMGAFSGGGVSSALMDVVAYYDDMNLGDKADALRGAITKLEELREAGDIENFKVAMQALVDSLEIDLSGQDVSNDPKANDVNHMMEKKLGKTAFSRKKLVAIIEEEILRALNEVGAANK